MAEVPVSIPRAGQATVEGNITEWLVGDGTEVAEGAPLYLFETDKVEIEIPSPASGVLSILIEAGGPFPVGTEIGRIVTT
jgi:pyruvate/2-oxoglutarate dehydrogenase complex dihydrolipoamide acyltransferase (E2) component